jgi:hypothetical protein
VGHLEGKSVEAIKDIEVFICERSGLLYVEGKEEAEGAVVRVTIAGKRAERTASFSEGGIGGSS